MEWIKLPNREISEEAKGFISKLNVPKKFRPLWENQGESIYLIDKYLKKVDNVILDMPTGTGKSLIAILSVNMQKSNYYLCTFVNALIDQYLRDFKNLACIRGRANYNCMNELSVKANESKCVLDRKYKCVVKAEGECLYSNALSKAEESDEVLTTPAYLYRMIGKRLDKRALLLIDEAHKLDDFYQSLIGLRIVRKKWDNYGLGGQLFDVMKETKRRSSNMEEEVSKWIKIIEKMKDNVKDIKNSLKYSLDKFKDGSDVEKRMRKQIIGAKNFIYGIDNMLEYHAGGGILVATHALGKNPFIEFKPINIYDYGKKLLDKVASKRIFMSATMPVPPQAFVNSLGLEEDNSVFIQVVEHTFPLKNRLVRLRYAGDMTYKHIDRTLPKMIRVIDEIMGERKDKRGLILPYTHKIRNYILDNVNGGNRSRLISNDNYKVALDTFIDSKRSNVVLISTVNEGLDLYGKLAEFLIMCKMPYPNISDEYVKARMRTVLCQTCNKIYIPKNDSDKKRCFKCFNKVKDVGYQWYVSQTGVAVVQMSARTTRGPDEFTELFFIDSAFDRWYSRNKRILSKWFRESIVRY